MKKLVIALVCVGLLASLTIPSIYSASPWLTYTLDFLGKDVTGEAEQCGARRRFISSHNIDLCLGKKFYGKKFCPVGQYLDLTEHKSEITMQFFFFDPNTGKKIMLKVDGGELDGVWLSKEFTIAFDDPNAVITLLKGREILFGGQER